MAAKNLTRSEQEKIIAAAVDDAQGFGPGRETSFDYETVLAVARRAAFHALERAGCLDQVKASESRRLDRQVEEIRSRENAWKASRR